MAAAPGRTGAADDPLRPPGFDPARPHVAAITGGRIVVHGVTLETEAILADAFRVHGGQLARLSVEFAEPIGRFWGWKPLRPVTQWSCSR